MAAIQKNLTVLIIDDDSDMRKSIVSYLEDLGFTVHQACGGCQGIRMFESINPDLVFTDLMMPGTDGLAVVTEIKKISPDTPVVVISGNGSVEYAIEAVRKGAWDYITKPILDFSVIDQIANKVLARADALKSERAYQESLQNEILSQKHQLSEINSLDPLTKLPLRNQMREKFRQILINDNFTGNLFVMLVELDNFKNVNKTFGHEYGDQLIADLAERIKTLVQENISVGRLGTDEFVVMVANTPAVMKFIAAVKAIFDEPFIVMGQEFYAKFNIGISSFPQDGESVDTLLQHADIARANARVMGNNHYCFYSQELWDQVRESMSLESGLRKGLARNEFQIYYQPKMDAQSHRMVGMEALLRWQPHGSNNMVSPVIFIPVLEESGLINEIGKWVLETACKQYVDWRTRGMGPVRLSVNISAIQFHSGSLPEIVKDVLTDTGMEPEAFLKV